MLSSTVLGTQCLFNREKSALTLMGLRRARGDFLVGVDGGFGGQAVKLFAADQVNLLEVLHLLLQGREKKNCAIKSVQFQCQDYFFTGTINQSIILCGNVIESTYGSQRQTFTFRFRFDTKGKATKARTPLVAQPAIWTGRAPTHSDPIRRSLETEMRQNNTRGGAHPAHETRQLVEKLTRVTSGCRVSIFA